MLNSKKFLVLFSLIFVYLFSPHNILALEFKSKYFDVDIHNDIDAYQLLEKLDIKYFLHIGTFPQTSQPDMKGMLKDTLDALYLEVSDILDIHMYSFQINLVILPDGRHLSDILSRYLANEIDVPSYYFYQKNAIYISFEDLTIGMLAHEIAHGIITHYFVIPPPAKIQEILCGYVEYSINKAVNR